MEYSGIFVIYILLVLNSIVHCSPANILFAMTGPNSHYECGVRVAQVLKSRGHNITFLVPKFESESPAVTKRADVFNFEYTSEKKTDSLDVGINIYERLNNANLIGKFKIGLEILDLVSRWWRNELEKFISDPLLMDRISDAAYDLIIVEGNFVWLLPFAQRHHSYFVIMTTYSLNSVNLEWFNLPTELSYIPFDNSVNQFTYDFRKGRLSFFERLINLVQLFQKFHIHTLLGQEMFTIQKEYHVATDWWGHDSFGRAEIWLTNSNFATDYPRPFFPNMGLVGGLTVEASKLLNNDFESIMAAAGDAGVIIVSMGTVIKSRSQNLVNSMAEAFAKLPQTVIWKATEPLPETVGENTLLRKWIPQNDLLGHPNTRAMVYHCGNNGAFEALYHGVPIIAVPVFADQTDVAYRIMSNGMGVVVETTTLTNESMFRAVSEVINNPKYKNRAMELSAIYRDYDTPVEMAAFWIEYVLRHRGARLLKSKAADMSFVKEYLLDVFAIFLVIGLLVVITTKHCFSTLLK
ncbi:UDP-glucuronosyltransferase 2C1 [Holothuria leucospilota]|uniref:UDP-glucuronosyltransferase 2C1 n=1 Tax=Holothuria leucospilota TaxID=206669 RepID=A0A9Q1BUB6_HOLLE|nr:UDP-glucuronosyltransferase 2C1 [Holothuria leucospilota]